MATQIAKVTIPFKRETKGSILYQLDNGYSEHVQNVYVKKEAFPSRKYPESVTVIIEIPS